MNLELRPIVMQHAGQPESRICTAIHLQYDARILTMGTAILPRISPASFPNDFIPDSLLVLRLSGFLSLAKSQQCAAEPGITR